MTYTRQTWSDWPGTGTPSTNQTGSATRLNYMEAGIQDASDRLDTLTTAVAAIGTGVAGPPGAEIVSFGPPDDTTVGVTGDVYGPFPAAVDYTIQPSVLAMLRGGASSGSTNFDVEISPSGLTGPWSSIFTSGKPTVAAGAVTGISGAPATTTLPAGGGLRAKILSAATGGGTATWRTPGAAGDGATATVTSLNIPIPTGTTTGDLMVAELFLPATSTPSWPSGWSAYGTPFPAGTDATLGPFYMHVATKTAGSSESTTQAVTFPSIASVMVTIGGSNVTLVTVTSSNIAVNGTAATTATTPSGLTTPAANCILAHTAMPRWTSGNVPSSIGWSGGSLGTSDAQAETARGTPVGTGVQNAGIAVAHETQASAGAITPRTASWTAQARSLTATLVFQPSSGSAPTGPEVQVRLRPVS